MTKCPTQAGDVSKMASDFSQSDVKFILKTYAEKQSTRFSDFMEVWRSMKCCKIINVFNERERGEQTDCANQFTHRHNLYILNGLIPAISEYLRQEHPEWYRVGAVYLLYAVYMNQPTSVDPVRVALTPEMYQDVLKLHRELRECKNSEADYALTCLFAKGAFVIALASQKKCLRVTNVHMHQRALMEYVGEDHAVFPITMKRLKTKGLQNMAASYHHTKEALSLPECCLHPSHLHSQLGSLMSEYEKWTEDEQSSSALHGQSAVTTTPSPSVQLHQRRRALINHAYGLETGSQTRGKRRRVAIPSSSLAGGKRPSSGTRVHSQK